MSRYTTPPSLSKEKVYGPFFFMETTITGIRGKTWCVLLHSDTSKHCVCRLNKSIYSFEVVKLFLKHGVHINIIHYHLTFSVLKMRSVSNAQFVCIFHVLYTDYYKCLFCIYVNGSAVNSATSKEFRGLFSAHRGWQNVTNRHTGLAKDKHLIKSTVFVWNLFLHGRNVTCSSKK
jgi:hypothetical protein